MKTLFTAEAVSEEGRSGSLTSPDGLLNLALGNPLHVGEGRRGPSPELLFAGAYAACYHGAVSNAAEAMSLAVPGLKVRVMVSLQEDDQGGYGLAVEIHAAVPGVDRLKQQELMAKAHETCPYSKAMRGRALVQLVVD